MEADEMAMIFFCAPAFLVILKKREVYNPIMPRLVRKIMANPEKIRKKNLTLDRKLVTS